MVDNVLLKRRLTLRYSVALVLIFCVMVLTFTTIFMQISKNEQDAYIINISGKQRMLSQRIALMSQEVLNARSSDEADSLIKKMHAATEIMKDNHNALVSGQLGNGREYVLSDSIKKHYLGEKGIDKGVRSYTGYADMFIKEYKRGGLEAVQLSDTRILIAKAARNGLLGQLDRVVSQYEKESSEKINQFKRIEFFFILLGVTILILEVLFIFKPMVNEIVRKTKSLDSTNKELLEFSYRVSHDLRAPIVSSKGLINVITDSIENNDKSQAKKAIEFMNNSLVRLEYLIDDIMNLTKMKMMRENVESFYMRDVILEAVGNLEHIPDAQNIDIRIDVNMEEPVVAEKIYVSQIVENLVSNGIKYYDRSIDNPYIDIRAEQSGQTCVFSVEDNGIGIPDNQQDNIFSMFTRFHPRVSFGSGLGLYLVKQNVEMLGGNITYTPLDKGTYFCAEFPLSPYK